ncbi:MAG: PilN domain-containing protein [Elusimicrobia bacterium]|nr:PilN domain-containing protein [Elusimicrobiota bacterium]
MIKINLLPKELQEKGKGLDWIILGYALIGCMAIAIVLLHMMQVRNYKKGLEKKANWSQQLSLVRSKVTQVEQLDAQKAVLNAKKNTVVQLFQGRLLYPKLMETLYDTMPKDVWLSDLTFSEDGQKNVRVVAAASALTTDSIADWLQMLESKKERFGSASLSAIDVKESGESKQTIYSFSMTFTYLPAAGI